jgi:hypothetical protein
VSAQNRPSVRMLQLVRVSTGEPTQRVAALRSSTPGLWLSRERLRCECRDCEDGFNDPDTCVNAAQWSWNVVTECGALVSQWFETKEDAACLAGGLGDVTSIDWAADLEQLLALRGTVAWDAARVIVEAARRQLSTVPA